MSRTDVHRPAWVQERDHTMRREFVAEHRHTIVEDYDQDSGRWLVRREVPCDLEEHLTGHGWARTRCGLRYVGGRNTFCGCQLCTGRAPRKLARKQERVRWRAERQRLLAETSADPQPSRRAAG
jgi:hypothetical protein